MFLKMVSEYKSRWIFWTSIEPGTTPDIVEYVLCQVHLSQLKCGAAMERQRSPRVGGWSTSVGGTLWKTRKSGRPTWPFFFSFLKFSFYQCLDWIALHAGDIFSTNLQLMNRFSFFVFKPLSIVISTLFHCISIASISEFTNHSY